MSDGLDDETRALISARRKRRAISPAALAAGGLAAAVLLLLVLAAAIYAVKRGGGGPPAGDPVPATAEEITAAYRANPIDADARWRGKWVKLPAYGVARVGRSAFGTPVLVLNHEAHLFIPDGTIRAEFASDGGVKGVEAGGYAAVVGRVAGIEEDGAPRESRGHQVPSWVIVLADCRVAPPEPAAPGPKGKGR